MKLINIIGISCLLFLVGCGDNSGTSDGGVNDTDPGSDTDTGFVKLNSVSVDGLKTDSQGTYIVTVPGTFTLAISAEFNYRDNMDSQLMHLGSYEVYFSKDEILDSSDVRIATDVNLKDHDKTENLTFSCSLIMYENNLKITCSDSENSLVRQSQVLLGSESNFMIVEICGEGSGEDMTNLSDCQQKVIAVDI